MFRQRKLPIVRSAAIAVRWPLGLALTSWHYLWRTTPLYRVEEPGSWAQDAPPPLQASDVGRGVQQLASGAGPLFHRVYRAHISGASMAPEELMSRLQADPDEAAASEFATFRKVEGDEGAMRSGDEYVVRMPGPWDGPVRVADVTPRSFRLLTLAGHLEAGQIVFRVDEDDGRVRFEIESWARSSNRLSDLLYSRMRMSKEVQLHMWTSFLERVIEMSGGKRDGGLRIHTRRVEDLDDTGLVVEQLRNRELNFDISRRSEYTRENGWYQDDVRRRLPPEPPGPPLPGGTWETARAIARNYDFADPSIVRAVFDADEPLERRTMLLVLHFHGLRIGVGVRVVEVYEEDRELDDRRGHVFGWSYATLEGHVEQGEMHWQVWKLVDDGEVIFRVASFSRPARGGNLLLRIGFRLFGRREQLRFLTLTGNRMEFLTRERTG